MPTVKKSSYASGNPLLTKILKTFTRKKGLMGDLKRPLTPFAK
ncbi:hypothetical protein F3D3_1162 [Fusibacter sp. 3D3]|nr:hypothetical protein F3D3_1162 [Fusibacter sp. 3D3]